MKGYRLYRFDRSGHFSSAEILAAESDVNALKAAADLLAGAPGELWFEGN